MSAACPIATQTASPTTIAPATFPCSNTSMMVTEINDMPDIGEMSVRPVAWATINAANASQTVPTKVESTAWAGLIPGVIIEATKKIAMPDTVPTIKVVKLNSSRPLPEPLVLEALAKELKALRMAGELVTTPMRAPPTNTPIPKGLNIFE